MYRTLGNLKNIIQRNAEENLSLQKILNSIGNEDTLQYLESVLKAFRQNKINRNNLNDNYQIIWIMELFGYGLAQPFSKYESINEIIQIYYSWLTALKSIPKPNLPLPVLKDSDYFAFKILDQLYLAFLPRIIDANPENIGYQAAACIQILLIITNLTEDSTGHNILLSHDIWEHILLLLLKINDTLLSSIPDSEEQEYITLGNLVGRHCIKTLFEVWIRSGLKYFPAPPFWKTLEEMCGSTWKYRYLPLIEQWNKCNYFLSETLIKRCKLNDLPNPENVEVTTLLSSNTSLHVIAQYWFRMLHVLGAPQDLLYKCLQKFSQQMQGMSLNKSEKPTVNSYFDQRIKDDEAGKKINARKANPIQRKLPERAPQFQAVTNTPQITPLALNQLQLCSVLFFRFITGIAKQVDLYLGFSNKEGLSNTKESPVMPYNSPPLPPMRKKHVYSSANSKDKKAPTPPIQTKSHSNLTPSLISQPGQNQAYMMPNVKQQITTTVRSSGVFAEKSSAFSQVAPQGNQPSSTYASQMRRRSEEFFALTIYDYDTIWKQCADYNINSRGRIDCNGESSIIFKCSRNTLMSIYGDWLFACGSLNTVSYPFAWIQSFNFGKAEACGTLCRIMCRHIKEERILPAYIFKFYLTIYSALTFTSSYTTTQLPVRSDGPEINNQDINVIQAAILCNSYDLFYVDLDGVSLLLPQFLTLIAIIFQVPTQTGRLEDQNMKMSLKGSSPFVLRNAAIRILASVVCLPTHAPNIPIQSLQPIASTNPEASVDTQSLNLKSSLVSTYGQLRNLILQSVYNATQTETDPNNMHLLLALLCITIQDFTSYQTNVNRINCQLQSNLSHIPNFVENYITQSSFGSHKASTAYNLQGGQEFTHSRASIPLSVYEACAMHLQPPTPELWCFDCLFETVVDEVLKTFDKWQNQDYTIAHLCLAALSHFAKIKMLIYKPVCENIIRRLCDQVIKMCSYAPIKHTKDVHTLIVALYNCLTIWLIYHPTLLDDAEILFLLLEITELGITGQKSQTDTTIYYKEIKDCHPVSKRVANASEYLLNIILILQQNASNQQMSNSFTFQQEMCFLQRPDIKYHYYSYAANIIMAIYEVPALELSITKDNDFGYLQRILVIHNQNGRYVWDITYDKAGDVSKYKLDTRIDQEKSVKINEKLCDKYPDNCNGLYPVPDELCDTVFNKDQLVTTDNNDMLNLIEVSVFPDKLSAQYFDQIFNGAISFEKLSPLLAKIKNKEMEECETPFTVFKPRHPQLLKYRMPKYVSEINIEKLFLSQLKFSYVGNLISPANDDEVKKEFIENLEHLNSIQTVPLDIALICYVEKNQNNIYEIFRHKPRQSLLSNKNFAEFITLLLDECSAYDFPNKETEGLSFSKTNKLGSLQSETNDIDKNVILLKDSYWEIRFIINPLPSFTITKGIEPGMTKNSSIINKNTNTLSGNGLPLDSTASLKYYLVSAYASQLFNPDNRPTSPTTLNNTSVSSSASPNSKMNYTEAPKRKSTLSLISTLSTDDGNISVTSSISAQPTEEKFKKQPSTHYSGSYYSQKHNDQSQSKILFVIAWMEQYQDYGMFPLSAIYDMYNDSSTQHESKIDIFVIFIHPLSNGLYKVAIKTTMTGKNFAGFPLTEGLVVSKGAIIPLVRETIIHSSLIKKFDNENYQMPESTRKYKIQNIISKFKIIEPNV